MIVLSDSADATEQARQWVAGCAGCDSEDIVKAASSIRQIEQLYLEQQPNVEEQLRYRIGPLLQYWDGYGNAIFAHLRRLTEVPRKSAQIDLFAVAPINNGDGFASSKHKAIAMESLLVNPVQELPEVLRLAWLLLKSSSIKHCNCPIRAALM